MTSKKFLFVSTRAPWQQGHAAACADALMTHAVFEQETWLFLTGDGVLQLLDKQDGSAIGQKTMAKLFPALEVYGVREVLVDMESLESRGLVEADLMMKVTIAGKDRMKALIHECDQVLVF